MSTPDQTIRKFNPGTFQSDEEVIQQFVVRHRELGIVRQVLRGNIDSPSCQHTLIVAPRGRGKTMLLARVVAELHTNDELSKHLLPVWFMEESHEVFDIADFWLETLFYLARENTVRDSELAQELMATHDDLAAQQHKDAFLIKERALAAVLEAADRLGKRLVLMVENLQDLCKDVEDNFGWQLREVLQTKPQIMLLATATSRFEGLDDAKEPFFELFRTIELKPLGTEECRRLWQTVSGNEVDKREIRPLEILTGGDPRLLVIIAGFAQHRSLRQLMDELVQLVDDHTEYFRSHLEGLPSAERRVYIAVIDLWQASTTGEIAKRARMDVRKVSSFLKRLIGRGVVLPKGDRRSQRYATTQRLYSIYYKLRRERGEAAVVKHLIFFLTVFYSGKDIREMSDKWRSDATQWPPLREGIRQAISEWPQIGRVFSDSEWFGGAPVPNGKAMGPGTRGIPEKQEQTAEVLFSEGCRQAQTLFSEGCRQTQLGQLKAAIITYDKIVKRFGDSDMLDTQAWVSMALVNKGMVQGQLGQPEAAIATYDTVVERFGDSDIPSSQEMVARALTNKGGEQGQLGQHEAAIATHNTVVERFGDSDIPGIQERVARALFNKGVGQGELGQSEAAIATYDAVVERFGDSDIPGIQERVAEALVNKGVAQERLSQSEAAIATFDMVVKCFGNSDIPSIQEGVSRALFNRGVVQGRLGQPEAAIATHDTVVERFSDSDIPGIQEMVARALFNKGWEQGRLGQPEAAIATYDTVVERFSDSDIPSIQERVAEALVNKGVEQGELGQSEAAIAIYDTVVERFGGSDTPKLQVCIAQALTNRGLTQEQLNQHEAAIATCDEVVRRFGDSDIPEIQVQVAGAMNSKGWAQEQLNQHEAAIATCNAVVKRSGGSDKPEIQVEVTRALVNKGVAQERLGQPEAAIATYDAVAKRVSDSEIPKLQEGVARALANKALTQLRINQPKAGIATCAAVVERFGDSDIPELKEQVAKVLWIRAKALLVQGQHPAAMDAFRSVVAAFVPGNKEMLRLMLEQVPDLIVLGAPERELVGLLQSDKTVSDALEPLIVALRQLAGEEVHAPAEVRETADDVVKRIRKRIKEIGSIRQSVAGSAKGKNAR